jgi:hypothetical protein
MIFDSFDVFTCSVALALMLYVYQSGRTDYFKGTILSLGTCLPHASSGAAASPAAMGGAAGLVYVLFILGYWMIPNFEQEH